MRANLLPFLIAALTLPVFATAQDVNPFQKPKQTHSAASIFTPAAQAPVIPPPLPLPPAPPIATASHEPVTKVSVVDEEPIPSKPCSIEVSPARPTIPAAGGEIILRVGEQTRSRGCINGIESQHPWLKIQHFNGQELTLLAEPNTSHTPRNAELIFANRADSLIIRLQQAAP